MLFVTLEVGLERCEEFILPLWVLISQIIVQLHCLRIDQLLQVLRSGSDALMTALRQALLRSWQSGLISYFSNATAVYQGCFLFS